MMLIVHCSPGLHCFPVNNEKATRSHPGSIKKPRRGCKQPISEVENPFFSYSFVEDILSVKQGLYIDRDQSVWCLNFKFHILAYELQSSSFTLKGKNGTIELRSHLAASLYSVVRVTSGLIRSQRYLYALWWVSMFHLLHTFQWNGAYPDDKWLSQISIKHQRNNLLKVNN